MNSRPDWDSWALGVAAAVGRRGDCTRRQVGATIRDARHRIVGEGYNGAHPGGPSCLTGDCPRGRHYRRPPQLGDALYATCACSRPWPCPEAVEPGSSYDTGPGMCIATHAEANALIDANGRELTGCTMYVTAEPCDGCLKLMRAAQLSRVVWRVGPDCITDALIHTKGLP